MVHKICRKDSSTAHWTINTCFMCLDDWEHVWTLTLVQLKQHLQLQFPFQLSGSFSGCHVYFRKYHGISTWYRDRVQGKSQLLPSGTILEWPHCKLWRTAAPLCKQKLFSIHPLSYQCRKATQAHSLPPATKFINPRMLEVRFPLLHTDIMYTISCFIFMSSGPSSSSPSKFSCLQFSLSSELITCSTWQVPPSCEW